MRAVQPAEGEPCGDGRGGEPAAGQGLLVLYRRSGCCRGGRLHRLDQVAALTELNGDQIAQAAGAYAGKPYVMGGATPAGWDCSGFMNWLLNIHLSLPIPGEAPGTNVPHGPVVSSWIQWSGCTTITSPEPGDLIAWGPNQHIGMVTGANEMISALNEQMGTVATSFAGGAADGAPVPVMPSSLVALAATARSPR